MSWNSGPCLTPGEDGRVVSGGYRISEYAPGHLFAAVAVGPLSKVETEYGCLVYLRAGSLIEILTLINAEVIKRDMLARSAAPDDVPLSRTLMGIDEPGTADGG